MASPPLSDEDQKALEKWAREMDRLAVYDGPPIKAKKRRMDRAPPSDRMYRIRIHCDPEPAGEEWPTLAEMQRFVGGYVEHVLTHVGGHELHLFVNEDGRRLGLPLNLVATCLYLGVTTPLQLRKVFDSDQVIVGNAWVWVGPLPPEA